MSITAVSGMNNTVPADIQPLLRVTFQNWFENGQGDVTVALEHVLANSGTSHAPQLNHQIRELAEKYQCGEPQNASRWCSSLSGGGPMDPGGWNKYAYTRDNGTSRIDPSGLSDCSPEEPACREDNGLPISGGGEGGGNGGSTHSVTKSFAAAQPCGKNAAQIQADVEQNFDSFANTNSNVDLSVFGLPVGSILSSATFSGGPLAVGSTILATETILTVVGSNVVPVQKTATLLVTLVTNTGFTLAPQPGAPLTGSITFSFSQTSQGSISESIALVGDPQGDILTQIFNQFALGSGGRQIEDNIWNNVLSNIAKDCNAPTNPRVPRERLLTW